jgi:hypothetical protein
MKIFWKKKERKEGGRERRKEGSAFREKLEVGLGNGE